MSPKSWDRMTHDSQGEHLPLVHRDDFLDLGNPFLQDSFYTRFHCHRSTGATLAGTLQTDLNGVIIIYTDQFYIAAMALQSTPKVLDCVFDLFFQCLVSISFAATALITHKKSPIIFSIAGNYSNNLTFRQLFLFLCMT